MHRKKRVKSTIIRFQTYIRTDTRTATRVPVMVPRPELSKNCFGHLRGTGSVPAWTSKNLLFGESRNVFLGEFISLSVRSRGRLVGVRGERGASFLHSRNLYALFFHLVISSCCLLIRLEKKKTSIILNGVQIKH